MKKPDNDETATALGFAHIPPAQRTPDQVVFLSQFQKHYLEPDEGMDPSAHAAELTSQTYEVYHLLRKDGLAQFKWPEKPASVHNLREFEPLPELERYSIEQITVGADPGGSSNRSRDERHEANTNAGDLLGTVYAHRRLRDEEIGQFLKSRQTSSNRSTRAKWTAKITVTAVLALSGYLGGKSVFRTKKAAEQLGGEVEEVQKEVGNFGDRIATDSSGESIPRTKADRKN